MKEKELRELMAKHRITAADADGLQKFTDIMCEEAEEERRAIAAEAKGVPDGYVLMPINPPDSMFEGMNLEGSNDLVARGFYKAFVDRALEQTATKKAQTSTPAPDLAKVREAMKDASVSCQMAHKTGDAAWVDDCQEKIDSALAILDAMPATDAGAVRDAALEEAANFSDRIEGKNSRISEEIRALKSKMGGAS